MVSRANAILEAKLALEAEITRPLLMLCTGYIESWLESSGQVLAIERMAWQAKIELTLRHHYARVAMVMTGQTPPRNVELHVAARSLRHIESLIARAKEQSRFILASIDRDLARGMSAADTETKAEKPVTGVTAGYMAKLKAAAASTIAKLKAKIKTIANAQTQAVAEEARIEVVADDQANGRLLQIWKTCEDDRVRRLPRDAFDHVAAHDQERWVGEPFEVSGERLRFPGDMSLGASLGNCINCRCWIETWFVSNETGERTLIHVGPSAPTRRFRHPNASKPPALKPTSTVTLNGKTRAQVVLGDGETIGTMRQPSPNTLEVLVNRRVVARADIVNGRAANVRVDKEFGNYDIDGLMRRSIEHSAARQR